MRILNTRPAPQNHSLSVAINNSGNIAIELPTIQTEATTEWFPLMPCLSTIKYAIFISPNAVNYYFTGLAQNNVYWNNNIFVIAIGTATSAALQNYNIKVDLLPSKSDSENLITLSCLQNIQQQSILLIKGTTGRTLIEQTLVQRGALLTILKVYNTRIPKYNSDFLNELWRNKNIDLILYTSQQGIYNLFTLFAPHTHSWLKKIPSLVISERLNFYAKEFGIKNIITCSYDQIIDTIKGLKHDQARTKDG